MNLSKLMHNVTLRSLCTVGIAFFGQLICVQRAFPNQSNTLLLGVLMAVSITWSWFTLRSKATSDGAQEVWTSWRLASLAIIVIPAFLLAKAVFFDETTSAMVNLACATVFAMLVGQIGLVATNRFGRLELLVLATVTTVTSFVVLREPLVPYRQLSEAAVAICLFALLANVGDRSPTASTQSSTRKRGVVSAIVLAIVIVVSRPVAAAMDSWLPTLQLQLSGAIEEGIVDGYRAPSVVSRYVDTASLHDVVDQYEIDPQGIALRVFSEHEPGYLRGRAFLSYGDGRWIRNQKDPLASKNQRVRVDLRPSLIIPEPSTPDSLSMLSSTRHDNIYLSSLSQFSLRESPRGRTITFEIENDPRRGEFFFLPLQATIVHGLGGRLVVDVNGVVQAGLDTRQTYFATVHEIEPTSSLATPLRELSLRVPSNLAKSLTELANDVCGTTTNSRAKARRLSDYFQKNHDYSLDRIREPSNIDPIKRFLETRHAAHCEYFASATALILRAAGVPTRYVTGYVVNQMSSDQDYWLARNLNAHAWVEAYDDETNRWFSVESTPGRTVPEYKFAADQVVEDSGQVGGEIASVDSSYEFDLEIWRLLMAGQWSLALVELSELIQWPLVLSIAVLLYVMFRRNQSVSSCSKDKHSTDFARLLRSADHYMKRRGYLRSNVESLHRFAERIESTSKVTPEVRDRANWYREIAELRYRSLAPSLLRRFPK